MNAKYLGNQYIKLIPILDDLCKATEIETNKKLNQNEFRALDSKYFKGANRIIKINNIEANPFYGVVTFDTINEFSYGENSSNIIKKSMIINKGSGSVNCTKGSYGCIFFPKVVFNDKKSGQNFEKYCFIVSPRAGTGDVCLELPRGFPKVQKSDSEGDEIIPENIRELAEEAVSDISKISVLWKGAEVYQDEEKSPNKPQIIGVLISSQEDIDDGTEKNESEHLGTVLLSANEIFEAILMGVIRDKHTLSAIFMALSYDENLKNVLLEYEKNNVLLTDNLKKILDLCKDSNQCFLTYQENQIMKKVNSQLKVAGIKGLSEKYFANFAWKIEEVKEIFKFESFNLIHFGVRHNGQEKLWDYYLQVEDEKNVIVNMTEDNKFVLNKKYHFGVGGELLGFYEENKDDNATELGYFYNDTSTKISKTFIKISKVKNNISLKDKFVVDLDSLIKFSEKGLLSMGDMATALKILVYKKYYS